jgi:GTP pyrophosphokinase
MALILSEELHIRNMDVVCAAILHNVLNGNLSRTHDEDAELREEIELIFGHRVLEIVGSLAMPALNYEEKDKVLSSYFENIAKSSKDVRYIKLADRLDNVRSLKNGTHKDKVLRYKEETQKYVLPIAEKTDEKLVFKLSVALYELK